MMCVLGVRRTTGQMTYHAVANVYPRSWARLTATIPAGTSRALLIRFALSSANAASAVPPDARVIMPASRRVAMEHTAKRTPSFASEAIDAALGFAFGGSLVPSAEGARLAKVAPYFAHISLL